MFIFMSLLIILSILIFLTCTLPGFLHITGIQKHKKIPMICVGLGAIFGISLIFNFMYKILYVESKCSNPKCHCKHKKGSNCDCNCNCIYCH